ncbi:MAG: Ada metal-binding domain-containing protein, partial [Candidatus Acidiferrales bacterium]
MRRAGIKTGVERSLEGDSLWRAVLEHDSRQDGRFVYAVRSTGIYC